MIRRSRGRGLLSKDFSQFSSHLSTLQRLLLAIALGFGVGIVTGVFGAGGGLMFLLLLIVVLGEPLHKAIGTSTLIMALTAFSGTIGYMIHGFLNILYSTITSLGSIIAGTISSRIANKLPEKKTLTSHRLHLHSHRSTDDSVERRLSPLKTSTEHPGPNSINL